MHLFQVMDYTEKMFGISKHIGCFSLKIKYAIHQNTH